MYLIYGKFKDMNRFEAIDLSNGTFVNRLIYASMFQDKDRAEKVAESLMKQNSNLICVVRKN